MNTRLEQFIAAENISQAEFADTIGVARASVSHILSGRNKPSFDFITGMMQHYPRLNMEWLLAGKGKMYKDPLGAVAAVPVPEETPAPDPDLFSAEPAPTTPRESQISGPTDVTPANTAFPERETPPPTQAKLPEPQRKIRKIVVFYDDQTFEELS